MGKNKEEYRRFIQNRSDIPVFFQDWWLDVVAGKDTWDVILVKDKAGAIKLILPYVVKTKWGLKISVQPALTPFLGPKVFAPDQPLKLAKYHSYEQQLHEKLAEVLKAQQFWYYNQMFPFEYSNWKALYWNGFEQTTYYRFVLENIKDHEALLQGFKYNKRYELNKFEQSEHTIEESEAAGQLYDLILSSYGDRQSSIPFSKKLYEQLDRAIQQNGHRKIFVVKNKNGQVVAGLLLLIDVDCAYLLNTGMDYSLKDSTVKTALIWHSIRYASQYVDHYDFCGSMLRPVANFFQGFGGKSKPYFRVFRYRNNIVKTIFTALGKG